MLILYKKVNHKFGNNYAEEKYLKIGHYNSDRNEIWKLKSLCCLKGSRII